ncbi:putative ABC transporter permease [Liberiplasma polymorphum]|uniref:putative ABC transporter permease n=1 Tax=Liberiplasma polymorphum TaxID=3374570 RepID=UPI0037763A06
MELFLYTVLYAFFGWILEVIFYIYKTKSFVNRGFLNGPFVPIYGVSLVSLHVLLFILVSSFTPITIEVIAIVFILITFISTLFELVGGIVLFNAFNARWWDYSDEKLNYKGYISLRFSVIWGVLGTIVFLGLHLQVIVPFVQSLSVTTLYVITVSLSVVLLIDYAYTLKALFSFKSLITEFKVRMSALEERTAKMKSHLPKSVLKTFETISENETLRVLTKKYDSIKTRLIDFKDKNFTRDFNSINTISKDITKTRLFKAFPELKLPFKSKNKGDFDA